MKRRKRLFLRAAGCIVFLALLASVVLCLDKYLMLVQEDNLCPRYYKYPKGTFDVTFLGASLVMYGIYPLELYSDYGISAYSLSTGNQSLEASYYMAKESIERDRPSLVVLDCSRAWDEEETMEPQYIHYLTDTMPYFGRNRIEMIRNLSKEGEDLMPLFFPLIAFHSRWQELTFEDALPQTKEKVYGAKVTSRVEVSVPFDTPQIQKGVVTESSRRYIEKTIELCRESGTELLLLTMPVIGKNKFFGQTGYNLRASAAAEVGEIAKRNGVLHANYLGREKELGLDAEIDAYDGEHLNRFGAGKFTKILGKFIKEHYRIPDRRGGGGVYDLLRKDLEEYPVNRMRDSLRRSLFLRDYAAALREDAFTCPVEDAVILVALNGRVDPDILTDKEAELLRSFGLNRNLHEWRGHGYIAVIDAGRVVYESSESNEENKETVDGKESAASVQKGDLDRSPGDQEMEAAMKDYTSIFTRRVNGRKTDDGDFSEFCEGRAGKVRFSVSSGRIDEESGDIHSAASIMSEGLEYASEERGLHFAVFQKSTGELLDACSINIYSRALSCTHDNH